MTDASHAGPRLSVVRLSVVVPSYNRRRSLEMVLGGLATQRGVPPGAVEFLVVLDGSTDSSAEMLAAWEQGGRLPGLRWHRQENAGQAAPRDYGARAAAAPVVLFLDDDVVPEPDLVARHLAHHATGEPRIAVLGDCEIVRDARHAAYSHGQWAWWEQTYSERALPGRLPCYTDFCAGNVSLRRDDYLATGGFDPAFRGYGGEDYDLGYRLLQQGVRFVADRRARAMHHHAFPGYARHLRSRRQEGQADVILGRKHPELRAGLRLARSLDGDDPLARVARRALIARGMSGLAWRARVARCALAERLGRRGRWARELLLLSTYAYWRGVRDALGTRDAVDAFRVGAVVPVQTLDIARPAPAVPAHFWVHGPSDVRVTAGGEPLGMVRLDGPVTRPVREVLAEAIAARLAGPVWLWAERTGAPLLPAQEDA